MIDSNDTTVNSRVFAGLIFLSLVVTMTLCSLFIEVNLHIFDALILSTLGSFAIKVYEQIKTPKNEQGNK